MEPRMPTCLPRISVSSRPRSATTPPAAEPRASYSCQLSSYFEIRDTPDSGRMTRHPEKACRTHPSPDLCTDGRQSAQGNLRDPRFWNVDESRNVQLLERIAL